MDYHVTVSPQAAAQIQQIVQYIAHTLYEPETAQRWVKRLFTEISDLAFMPSRYPLTEELPWRTMGIRKMSVKNFLVYYLVEEAVRRVTVTAVIYGRRDQLSALTEE